MTLHLMDTILPFTVGYITNISCTYSNPPDHIHDLSNGLYLLMQGAPALPCANLTLLLIADILHTQTGRNGKLSMIKTWEINHRCHFSGGGAVFAMQKHPQMVSFCLQMSDLLLICCFLSRIESMQLKFGTEGSREFGTKAKHPKGIMPHLTRNYIRKIW